MKLGTKSVLFGAHAFWLHPFFVAAGWTKLYGFPWDLRLWAAFFLHDIGYIGKSEMDSEEGELHPFVGAKIVGHLCGESWRDFCLFHSRHLSKKLGKPVSKLCFADKLATCLTPAWLYLPMTRLTGEIKEYRQRALENYEREYKALPYISYEVFNSDKYWQCFEMAWGSDRVWLKGLKDYMRNWVKEHVNGKEDTWTANRYGKVVA